MSQVAEGCDGLVIMGTLLVRLVSDGNQGGKDAKLEQLI